MRRWSASQCSQALSCGLAWRYAHVAKLAAIVPAEECVERDAGSLVHHALARATRRALLDRLTAAELLGALEESDPRGAAADRARKIITETGEIELPRCFERWVEKGFKVEIAGREITGYWDRVDVHINRAEVVDYKSTWKGEMRWGADNPQTLLYLLAARQATGKANVAVTFLALPSKKSVRHEWHPGVPAAAAKLLAAAEQEADHGPGKVGRGCGWCGYRALCPALRRELESPGEGLATLGREALEAVAATAHGLAAIARKESKPDG